MVKSKSFEELSNYELWEIAMLRSSVFTFEQKIMEEELEEADYQARHYFIKKNNKVVAYARLINNKIGRICTNKNYRNQGYQTKIINSIKSEFDEIVISSQLPVVSFYEKLGFKSVGKVYLEANIKHIKMVYNKQKDSL